MVTGGRLRLSGIAPVARNPGARVRSRAHVWRAAFDTFSTNASRRQRQRATNAPSLQNENAFPNRVAGPPTAAGAAASAVPMGDVGSGSLLPGAGKKPGVASPGPPALHGKATARSAAAKIQARFRKFMDDRDKRHVASKEGVARDSRGVGGGAHHVLLGSDDESSDEEEDADANAPFTTSDLRRPKLVKCAFLTLCWFGLSTALAMYNKVLFGARRGGFPAPLLLTSVQFAMQWMLASLILTYVAPSLRPRRAVDWNVFTKHVAPVGVAMGLDIGLSNLSLVHVTVSFYTLAKTSSILFLLAFAFAIGVEPVSLRLTAAVLLLCLGEVLTVRGETQFNALGAALCFAAAAASGVRWVLSQTSSALVRQKHKCKKHAIDRRIAQVARHAQPPGDAPRDDARDVRRGVSFFVFQGAVVGDSPRLGVGQLVVRHFVRLNRHPLRRSDGAVHVHGGV
jgi:hypothetical protein